MSGITFHCQQCGQKFNATSDSIGSVFGCHACGAEVTVADPSSEGLPPTVEADLVEVEPLDESIPDNNVEEPPSFEEPATCTLKRVTLSIEPGDKGATLVATGGAEERRIRLRRIKKVVPVQGDTVLGYLLKLILLIVLISTGAGVLVIFLLGLSPKRRRPELILDLKPRKRAPESILDEMACWEARNREELAQAVAWLKANTSLSIDEPAIGDESSTNGASKHGRIAPGVIRGLAIFGVLAVIVVALAIAVKLLFFTRFGLTDIGPIKGAALASTTPVAATFAETTLSGKSAIRLWDLTERKELVVLELTGRRIACMDLAHDASLVAAGFTDGAILLWDAKSGSALQQFRLSKPVSAIACRHSRSLLAAAFNGTAADLDGRVTIWKTTTGEKLFQTGRVKGPIHAVALSPNGRSLAAAGKDLPSKIIQVIVWDTTADRTMGGGEWRPDVVGDITRLVFSPSGKLLAAGSRTGHVQIYRLTGPDRFQSFQFQRSIKTKSAILSLEYSPDGNQLILGTQDGTIEFWNPDGTTKLNSMDRKGSPVHFANLIPNTQNLLIADGSKSLEIIPVP